MGRGDERKLSLQFAVPPATGKIVAAIRFGTSQGGVGRELEESHCALNFLMEEIGSASRYQSETGGLLARFWQIG